jgi:DNA mismatch repair protein MutL
MPNIQVLDPHVADLIAAGEVVERPASVAKELLENAIDAGASTVTVEINHGGMTFLRVTDDGKGIPVDQLKTAFLRHATSKLHSAYDLEAIGTLGFRGEALAAISAVSRLDVMTRTADSDFGASLSLEGGVPGEVEEAGCPLGTTMVVRDLFYNTPARLKFMKKDVAEGAAVFAVVQRVALSHPELSVKFIRDGKQELLTPGDGQLQSAMYAVLGRELALGFRPVLASGEDMKVSGFVSMPACCRGSRNLQFFFVNGRYVKSRLMMAALEEAYQNQKMVGKFPGCVLHLETRLNAVDVNVHPAKTEVKFGSERQVFSAVYHAVLSALEQDRSRPAMELEPREGISAEKTAINSQKSPYIVEKSVENVENFAQTQLPFSPMPSTTLRVQDSAYRPQYFPTVGNISNKMPNIPQEDAKKPEKPCLIVEKPVENVKNSEEISAGEKELFPQNFPQPAPWRLVGEVFCTYVIVEQGDKVFFIDKHAAHERMNFDRMKAQGYDPMAQTLLTPVTCRLPGEETAALMEHTTLLEEFGFDVDTLGGSVVVRQAPFDVDAADIESTLSEIAQKLLTTGRADPAAARDGLLHTMACKAAIKGGWHNDPQELERVAQAVMSGHVKYCPHGRPVAIELTKKELEKQFKRA